MSRSIIPFHVLDLSGLYTMLSYASEPKRGISMGTSCGKPVSPPFSKPKKAMEYHSVVVDLVKVLSSIKWRKEYLQMNTKH